MARADAPRAVPRSTALLLLWAFLAPHGLALARAAGPAAQCCIDRSCCCPPKAASTSCHGGAAEPAAIVRCHHPAPEATVPAMPALAPARVAVLVRHAEGRVPTPAPAAPRLGFGRIESPPPRSLAIA